MSEVRYTEPIHLAGLMAAKANDGGASKIDPGTYEFEVMDIEQRPAVSSGKPTLRFKVQVVDDSPMAGRTMFHTVTMDGSPFCLGRLKQFWLGMGIELQSDDIIPEEARGRHFVGDVVPGKPFPGKDAKGNPIMIELMNIKGERPVEYAQPAQPAAPPAPPPAPIGRAPVPAAGVAGAVRRITPPGK